MIVWMTVKTVYGVKLLNCLQTNRRLTVGQCNKAQLKLLLSEYGLSKVPKTYGKTAKFQAKKCIKGLTHVTSGQICWWE